MNRKKPDNKNISIICHRELIKPNTLTVAAYPHFYPICDYNSRRNLACLDVDILKKFEDLKYYKKLLEKI
jgi:hypothetical protein